MEIFKNYPIKNSYLRLKGEGIWTPSKAAKVGISMITKNNKTIDQIQMVSIEQLVPQDHILRKIDAAIDFDFIYDLVEERYCPDNGRPSIDPVVLIKIAVIQYMFGIKSMRQTIKEIEVNIAYR